MLEGNKKAATLALYTAYNRLGRPLMEAVLDVEKYPDRVPNDFDNLAHFMTEEAAMMVDEETGLYGFMTAAVIGGTDLSYSILRAFPSVIGRFIEG